VNEGEEVARGTSQVADRFVWLTGAVIAATAAQMAVRFDTPIDRAIPLVVLFILAWSWCVRTTRWWAAVQLAIPAIIAAALLPLDEPLRLAVIGMATGAAFAVTLLAQPAIELRVSLFLTTTAIVLLRWLPPHDARLFREVLVLAGAWLIVLAFQRHDIATPIAIAIAIVTALVTPAIPLRTVSLPYMVAGLAAVARVKRLRFNRVGAAICALVLALFPWSGIAARAGVWFLSRHPDRPRQEIRVALPPGHSIDVWLPQYSESLIVSGANVARLPPRTILGWIEPGHRAIRMTEASDWGYMRRDQFYKSRNHLPNDPAGKVRDYGYSAWIDGAGRVALPVRRGTIRVTADPRLPRTALLQVESLEMTRR